MTRHPDRSAWLHAWICGVAAAFAIVLPATRAGAEGAAQPRTASEDRWAVVSASGTLVRSKGAASVSHGNGSGTYAVHFDKSVTGCAYVAALGNPAAGVPPRGRISVYPGGQFLDVAGVRMFAGDGTPIDRNFHLFVVCRSEPRTISASPGETDPQGALPEPRTTASDRWAVVSKDGTLARGKGVTSLARLGKGRYEIIFNRDVSRCVFVASIGLALPDPSFVPPNLPAGLIGVAVRANNKNGVYVRTWNTADANADRPFHLFVGCEEAPAGTNDPWAVIAADGTLWRGNGVVSTTRFSKGRYHIVFDRNVRKCAYIATIGEEPVSPGGTPWGEISTAPLSGNKNGVYVHTRFGATLDRPFYLYVGCG